MTRITVRTAIDERSFLVQETSAEIGELIAKNQLRPSPGWTVDGLIQVTRPDGELTTFWLKQLVRLEEDVEVEIADGV